MYISVKTLKTLTLILLTWRIWWAPNNASKWQMGLNSAFKGLKNIKNYAVMLCLVSDIFPLLILYSWWNFRLLSPVLSGWISILTVKVCWCHLFHEVITLAKLVVHVCWLCSLCHIVDQKRFLFVFMCYGWLLLIISTLHWFYFWCFFIYNNIQHCL